jgi:phenylalanine-4-hydroxylase
MNAPSSQPNPAAQHDDWTVDQHWAHYTAQEHAVWRRLYQRQCQLLPGRACAEFVAGLQALPIGPDEVPNFAALNRVLMAHTGWQVVAVPGLVPDAVFFHHLAHRRFPAGRFLRRADQWDYLEEPDVFHDVFGHVPLLMNPVMANFLQAYGQGGLRAQQLGHLAQLARVYWYTVEFGLLREQGQLRLYGAGIASSHAESLFCLEDPSPHHIGFELSRVMRTRYRIDDFQEGYFVLDSLEALLALAQVDFAPLYARTATEPELQPGDCLPTDTVWQRGSGAYHRARRACPPPAP